MRSRTGSIVLALCATLLLSSCAMRAIDKVVLKRDARVGVMFLLDENPEHIHFGTTVLSNFIKPDIDVWQTRSQLTALVSASLSVHSDWIVSEVEPTFSLRQQRLRLMDSWRTKKIRNELMPEFERLAAENKIDYLIAFVPTENQFRIHPGTVHGYGVYSRCMLGTCAMDLMSHLYIGVFEFNPLRYVGAVPGWTESTAWKPDSVDLAALSSIDLDRVRVQFFDDIGRKLHEALVLTGLLPEQ